MSKVLAIDYGKKRCGFAISDEDQSIAFPLETVDNKEIYQYIKNITENDLYEQSKYKGKPMDIAVTGGSGLIGSQLIPYLTTAGHKVENIVRGRPRKGELVWDIDKNLVSGVKIQVGSLLIDTSVSNKLKRIKQSISKRYFKS